MNVLLILSQVSTSKSCLDQNLQKDVVGTCEARTHDLWITLELIKIIACKL